MPDKRIFLAKIILFAMLIWQPAVAQMSSLPACTIAVDDTDNDGVDSTIDVDKDGDGLIEICDLEGLNEMRYQLDGSGYATSIDAVKITQGCPPAGCKGYELMRSLDFNVADSYRDNMVDTTWTTSTGWQPIGSNTNRFNSIFEGNGYTISGLYIKADSYLGLFASLHDNGGIQNVGLLDAEVEGTGDSIGGLVGFSDGSIINSYTTGAVTGDSFVGGLVGLNDDDGSVTNSYATGAVTGSRDVGGLVGWSFRGGVTNSYAMGAVTGNSEVGGLVGDNEGSVTDSYATGAVTGSSDIGGLVGDNEGSVTNSYAMGAVTGSSEVGGLVGVNDDDGSVTNSYATGAVTGTGENVGGLVGVNDDDGSVTNSYATGAVTGTGDEVGGLVGYNDGDIMNSYATGAVTGTGDEVGGLVGFNYGRITNSYATGAVTGTGDEVGGLVGQNGNIGDIMGDITNSYATGAVAGTSEVGGLVGVNYYGRITNSYAMGAITGTGDEVGGLVGWSFRGSVTNSYATGAVTGTSEVGGLVGFNYFGSVTNSYATGAVTGTGYNVGGLVGDNDYRSRVTNSYWNTQTSGLTTSAGGEGKITTELQLPTTTTSIYSNWSTANWDFGTSSQYPILKKSDGTLLSPTLRYGLSQLRLAKGYLSPDFISIIPNYTGSVVVDTNTIQLIPVAINANARIHITGRGTQEIASGATSDDIMLNEDGITTITIVVVTAGISIEYNFNLRYYQYSGDVDIDNDGLIEIDNIEDLNAIRYQLDGTGYRKEGTAPKITTGCPSTGCKGYELTKSLSFAEDSDWSPIALFSGIFEGNGYTISKLRINKPNASNLGFFSFVTSGAKINNIGLLDIDIQGDSSVGGLVGFNDGRITNSYAAGAVAGTSEVGGLVGYNGGSITNSYAMGAVAGTSEVGGLVGENNGSITNSYAMGAVTGNWGVGGLVGFNGRGRDITNSYATGAVTGTGYNVGGLVGSNGGSVTASYWDTQTSGLATSAGGDGVTSAATAQLQSPTAPGMTTTEVYYGWSSDDWDFGDNSHYPALRHARGDDLNACNPDITTPSAILACAVPLPNQRDRNQGLTALFVLADGEDVTAELIPTFFPLKSSYDNIIATTETAVQLTLRPYAINNNATITITNQDNADYFVGKPDGALSDPIMLSDSITLTLVVTDTIDEATVNTTYTFIIKRDPLEILEITIESATNADGAINEASMASILFDVVGGVGSYRYEYKIIVGTEEILLSQSEPPVELTIPDNVVAIESTQQTIELNIIVSDSVGQTFEYREALTIQKVDNGVAELNIIRATSKTLIVMMGADPDGATDDSAYQWQWLGTDVDAEWMDIESATSTSYTITDELAVAGNEFRVAVAYTDGQGYRYDALYSKTMKYDLLPRCALAIADRDGDDVDSSIDVDKDDDGLIELCDLEGIDEMRYQADGRGYRPNENAINIMRGCPLVDGEEHCRGYELMRSLDFNAADSYRNNTTSSKWTTASGWLPIAANYSAVFEGNGHSISGLYIARTDVASGSGQGLFSTLAATAQIKNIRLLDVTIQGLSVVGAVASRNSGIIINSSVSGAVEANADVGGLVGINDGHIISSFADVAVSATINSGGLVGRNQGAMTNSYASGDVTASGDNIGGLVGLNNELGRIINTYAEGTVMGASQVGGLVGSHHGLIMNSYATIGGVSGSGSHLGGLIGMASSTATVIASYWDTERSGIESSGGGSGKTTAELQTPIVSGTTATEVYYRWNTSDWDFGDSNHYPALRYASGADPDICTTEITTSSAVLPCTILLPEQRGRNKGLAEVFFFAGGEPASVVLDPIFSQLIYNYDMTIVASDLDIQLRPYALNDNVAISINKGNTNYFSDDRPNGALSGAIRLADNETTLTLVITDIIDEIPVNTTYTFVIERLLPVQIDVSLARFSVILEPATPDPDGAGVFSYQWQQQVPGSGWTDIPDATTATYWLPADADGSIRYRLANIKHTDGEGYETIYPPQGPFRASVDDDGDGLIDIYYLQDMDAMRYQLNGRAYQLDKNAELIMRGCPATGCKGYELMRSLDFNVADSYQDNTIDTAWTTSTGWQPIGSDTNRFSGIFEGNGHTIANLFIDREESNLGLFSVLHTNGRIQNVGLLDAEVEGTKGIISGLVSINYGVIINSYVTGEITGTGDFIGGLVGFSDGSIINSYATGEITGTGDFIGSLVGSNNGNITNSYATGTVTGGVNVGGLVGSNNGDITNSYVTGAVTGGANVGGLVGSNNGNITNSYATGAVTGYIWVVGGLVGENDDDGSVMNSYATGAVTGNSWVGGLVGENDGDITNSYATGAVTGTGDNVGGLVGSNEGDITNSYWDTQTSGLATSAGGDGVTSATTTQLQSPTVPGTTTTEIYYGWSSDDWDFGDNSHYPALRYARGDDLNACNPNITTSSAVLSCQVLLPNQSDRNQGLAALFLLADGNDVTAQYIPTFFPLKSSYDIIVTTETAVQLTLRPYAINNNATITITDQDNRNYFAGKPNGALSDVIRVSDSLNVTVVVTDTIAEGTTDTTYILAIRKVAPIEVPEVTISLLPAAHADGTINEGSNVRITYTVSGGSGVYQYSHKLIAGADETLLSQSPPPVNLVVPVDTVSANSTKQVIELNIRVGDDVGQTFEHREVLTIRKVNNGVAELVVSRETTTMTIMVGSDVDGDPDPNGYNYQWQSRALGTDSEWTNIMSATDATYTIPKDVSGEFRVQVTYTDRQGYDETLASDVIEYRAPSQGIKIRTKVFLEGPLR